MNPRRAATKPPGGTRPERALPAQAGTAGTIRLSKRMADLGLASRREADEWIGKGWVLVDGVAAELGTKVPATLPAARITVRHAARREQSAQVTILLHKPVGYVSTQAEPGYTPAITLVTAANRWSECRAPHRFAPSQLRHLAVAGRLDIDSTGLLVLTQDGRIARQLIGEDGDMDKEYLVRVLPAEAAGRSGIRGGPADIDVQSTFPPEQLALLRHGLSLDGRLLRPAQVEWVNPQQLRFVLHEGRKRQIRRMCELVGLRVVGLKRVRVGNVRLGALPPGRWRYLRDDERF